MLMLKQIIDLHIHSRYSRACSRDLELPKIASACTIKGVDIIGTGDFTHPMWLKHIKENLEEIGKNGIYRIKFPISNFQYQISNDQFQNIKFILTTELSCIYKHGDKTRRLHHVILAPNIAAVEKLVVELEKRGVNLKADGRPIMGLHSKELLKILLEIDPAFMLIPAHAWTPWFGVFGSKGGYNTLEECFGELTPHIRAIETGLSSDPAMNWRWSKLDNITLVSNSDAHSLSKIGREANVFGFENEKEISYSEIIRIIKEGDKKKFLRTIEFYPEEGKYHYDGHRDCKFVCSPIETKKLKGICPKCKKSLTVGVMNRADELADRSEAETKNIIHIPYQSMVPLAEIISDVLEVGVSSKKVAAEYNNLIKKLGSEFKILLETKIEQIALCGSPEIARAIERVRAGNIFVRPGYDGEFGVVKVFEESEIKNRPKQASLLLD